MAIMTKQSLSEPPEEDKMRNNKDKIQRHSCNNSTATGEPPWNDLQKKTAWLTRSKFSQRPKFDRLNMMIINICLLIFGNLVHRL